MNFWLIFVLTLALVFQEDIVFRQPMINVKGKIILSRNIHYCGYISLSSLQSTRDLTSSQ